MRTFVLLSLLTLGGCLFKKSPKDPVVPDTTVTTTTQPAAAGTTGTATDGTGTGVTPDVPVVLTEEQKAIARREKAKEAAAMLTSEKFDDARRALTLLRELEKDMPESAEVAYNIGVAQYQLGNNAMAEQSFRRATKLEPELIPAWLGLGLMAEQGGDANWALNVYGQGVRAAPEAKDVMDLHSARIALLIRQGRLQEAEAAAKDALAINANAQSVYANLALVYIQQGKLELGKFIIQRAFNYVDGAEDNANLHAYLGRIFYLQDHPFEARAAYKKALELDSKLLDAMIFLSELHLDNRAYLAMVPLLERATKVAPDDAAIHMNLGIAYRGAQRFEDAEKEYQKVQELLPSATEPYLNLAILYGDHQKKYEQAMQILDQYKGLGGADVELADQWIVQYQKEKERAERTEGRRRAAEERRKKREEEQRFLKQFEEEEKRKAEEEARLQKELEAQQAAEAAAAGAAGQPDPAAVEPGTDASQPDTTGTDAAPPDAAPPDAPQPDTTGTDAAPPDAPQPDATGADAPQPDATGADASPPGGTGTDAAQPVGAVEGSSVPGTAPEQPVSEPSETAPAPAAPSEPSGSDENAAGQQGEGDASGTEEVPASDTPWGG